jgi:1-carboxybiuret hydrolase subunit AtzG-like protein
MNMADNDSSEYLRQTAQRLGLTLPDAELARVKLVFGNLERLAAQLRDIPLADDAIAAAVFCPRSGE